MKESGESPSRTRRPASRWKTVSFYLLAAIGAACAVWWAWAQRRLAPVPLVISPETTLVVEPLLPDGTPDYLLAARKLLDEKLPREGPNAAAPLLLALGPTVLMPGDDAPSRSACGQVLAALGLADLPEAGDYLVGIEEFAKARGEKVREREAMKYPHLDEWLEANAKPLELVLAASEMDRFDVTLLAPSTPRRLAGCPYFRWASAQEATTALLCRARRSLERGDPKAAFRDARAVLRLGALACQDRTLMGLIVGVTVQAKACEVIEAIAARRDLEAGAARQMLGAIRRLPAAFGYAEAMRLERLAMLELSIASTREAAAEAKIDPNLVLRATNDLFGRFEAALRQPAGTMSAAISTVTTEAQAAMEDVKRRAGVIRLFFIGSSGRREFASTTIGTTLTCLALQKEALWADSEEKAGAHIALARAALALRGWKAERGSFPAALTDLVPGWLPEPPAAPDGRPQVEYRREGEAAVLSIPSEKKAALRLE